MNSTPSSSTQITPFVADTGREPRSAVALATEHSPSNPLARPSKAQEISTTLAKLRDTLIWAQTQYLEQANSNRNPCEFKVGEEVMLNIGQINLPNHPKSKLKPRWLGPFKITGAVGNATYRLDISLDIHKVFNADRLKRYFRREGSAPSRPKPDRGGRYEVERIINRRFNKRAKRLEYLVKWTGYAIEDSSWLPLSELSSCKDSVDLYEFIHSPLTPPKT